MALPPGPGLKMGKNIGLDPFNVASSTESEEHKDKDTMAEVVSHCFVFILSAYVANGIF